MLSSVTTIRNLFILLAALALATGCTTAKTLGTSVSAVAATEAPSSDTGTAEAAEAATTEAPSSDTGTAEAAEAATTEAPSSDTGTAEAAEAATTEAPSSDTGTAEAAEAATTEAASSDTGTAEAAEAATTEAASSDTGTAATTEAASSDTGTAATTEAAGPKPWTPHRLKLWVVDDGEHLWGISAHHMVYGDPYQWPLLFKRNRHQIDDADLIYPGQILHIERDLNNAEIDRAIKHAKTRGAWILGITELADLEYLSRERSYE